VALKNTCIKNAKFKIIKTRTGQLQDMLLQPKPKLGRTNPWLGHMQSTSWAAGWTWLV